MRVLRCWLMLLCFAIPCTAQQAFIDLQRRADLATGTECIHLSMQAARQSLEEANTAFGGGDSKTAHLAIDTSLRYATRSVDCTIKAHKGEKNAEIDIRKLIHRMKDVQKTLDSEDRPHLERSLLELEKQRDRLLQFMFGAAAPGGAPEKKP